MGLAHLGLTSQRAACVEIAVEPGEIGRRYFEADAVAFFEDVSSYAEVNFVGIDAAGFEQGGVGEAFPKARTQNAVAEVHGIPGRGYIDELGGPVRVCAVGGGVDDGFDGACDFQGCFKGIAGVAEYVASHLYGTLVIGTPRYDVGRATVVAAHCRYRVVRVVSVVVRRFVLRRCCGERAIAE